ncbi:hypothetical protein OG976_10015 [Mycobacterium sp. NBC_00419]|uniref:hypothetical protein n=1 Tax=Mycobacterium sp. NBC_00419 TaxID=2975989 RepID=UPI002E21AA1B
MIRPSRKASFISTLPVLAVLSAATALAAPDGTGTPDSCQFGVTKPALTLLTGGAQAVVATAVPTSCTGLARPTSTTVCVSTPDANGYCDSRNGFTTAQAAFPAATAPRGEYIAKARGCYSTPGQSQPLCTSQVLSTVF